MMPKLQKITEVSVFYFHQGLRGTAMERHLEESSQQHLVLMCSLVTRQQHQIASLKSALARVSLNHSGKLMEKIVINMLC